jgi:hypothetical protein
MSETITTGDNLEWRVCTPALLQEILNNPGCQILLRPLQIFGHILAEVGERASEINDPKLNALMCRLAIYDISDPYNKAYDKELTNEIISKFY